VRGTGPAGLAAMAETRDGFIRPLLAIPRVTIEAYVAARALPVWQDPMNTDPQFFRTRIRHALLPALRDENPAIDDALVRLARASREWLEVIDELACPFAHWPMSCSALAAQPAAIRKRALAIALDAARLGYDAQQLDLLDALVTAPTRGEVRLHVKSGTIVRSYDTLTVAASDADAEPVSDADSESESDPDTESDPDSESEPESESSAYLLRPWLPGDRMRPARLRGHSRKLADLFVDAKLPRPLRRQARVLVRLADQTIVWAEHVGVAFGERAEDLPLPARKAGTF
jgi:tRNA(Ile)-lysidine synthase